jgi:pilus assembly protein Flp/PilA
VERWKLSVPKDGEMVIQMKKSIINFLRDERGLTTVEYAVAGGLISLAVVAAFALLGASVDGVIRNIDAALP